MEKIRNIQVERWKYDEICEHGMRRDCQDSPNDIQVSFKIEKRLDIVGHRIFDDALDTTQTAWYSLQR